MYIAFSVHGAKEAVDLEDPTLVLCSFCLSCHLRRCRSLQPSPALLPEKLLQLQCGSLADSKGVEETYIKFPVSCPFCLPNYVDSQILCISDIIVSFRAPLGTTHSWLSRNRIVNHQNPHYGGRLTLQLLVTCISQNRLGYVMVTKLTLRSCLLKKKQTFQPR